MKSEGVLLSAFAASLRRVRSSEERRNMITASLFLLRGVDTVIHLQYIQYYILEYEDVITMPDKEIQVKFSEWADKINQSHLEAEQSYSQALLYAKEAGDAINLVYARIGFHDRSKWMTKYCPSINTRTARSYTQVSENWEWIKSQSGIHSIRDAIKSLPKPDKKIGHGSALPSLRSKVESNNNINPKSVKSVLARVLPTKSSSASITPPKAVIDEVKPQPASLPEPEVKTKSPEDELDSALEQVYELTLKLKKLTIERDTLTDKLEDLESNLKTYRLIRKKIGDDWENFIENLGL